MSLKLKPSAMMRPLVAILIICLGLCNVFAVDTCGQACLSAKTEIPSQLVGESPVAESTPLLEPGEVFCFAGLTVIPPCTKLSGCDKQDWLAIRPGALSLPILLLSRHPSLPRPPPVA